MTTRLRNDRGSVSTEMAAVMVAFLGGFLLLVVFAGRVAQGVVDALEAIEIDKAHRHLAPVAQIARAMIRIDRRGVRV